MSKTILVSGGAGLLDSDFVVRMPDKRPDACNARLDRLDSLLNRADADSQPDESDRNFDNGEN